ncbi:PilZ domain-containing protein [Kaarinaea lacus]
MQQNNNNESEKRIFPRMETECPVLYAVGNSKKWQVGILVNYSATGLLMKCKERLLKNINISILFKPGQNRLVPEVAAKGKVIRCNQIGEDEFEVSCKLTEIKPQKKIASE